MDFSRFGDSVPEESLCLSSSKVVRHPSQDWRRKGGGRELVKEEVMVDGVESRAQVQRCYHGSPGRFPLVQAGRDVMREKSEGRDGGVVLFEAVLFWRRSEVRLKKR